MTEPPVMTSNRPYLLRAVYEWICDNGLTPYIVVDARHAGVRVPASAVADGRVVLNIAARAVAHLELGNEVIRCMARFGGVSHPVEVPVPAVQAIYARENGQGMLLPPDAPTEGEAPAQQNAGAPLAAVPDAAAGQDGAAGPSDAPGTDKPPPKGKPTLRVVK